MLLPGLKSARTRAGLTQEQLAAAAGVSSATVFKHEQGQVNGVSGRTLQALATALKVDARSLFLPAHSEGSE
ncbi:helix-turn-helix domain-containing protein [Deinococcus rufus]|uniref:Helix-turn-helix domain-containing protein n=2 Tax=Deinococcus TaxID=1298 RepID=A0ABV7ZBI8_9DEIO